MVQAPLMSRSMVNTRVAESKRGSDDSGTTSDAPPDAYSPNGSPLLPSIDSLAFISC